ncbi:sensor histidine kinase [Streptomyces sp. SP18CS02]|uniref:sensor histidine kinase n=1 Tax=Streptomyces sp. SP18CS02 TaxID=3002531 RepID=UPI002E7767F2|nr:sensor domain-containing protein [Streptomyces sp. SP18CS02]MEE1755195.1 sensor domain-containing protein [Streptomyces sp. SP18CS02]
MNATRTRASLLAAGRGFVLSLQALVGSVVLFSFTLVSIALVPIGIGLVTTPFVLSRVRAHAGRRRALAARWSDVRIPESYRPPAPDPRGGFLGQAERCLVLLKDPVTWRDVLWLFTDISAGFLTALMPALLLLYPLEGLVLAAGLWRVFQDDRYWYAFVPVDSQPSALAAAALGLCVLAVGLRGNPAVLRAHFLLAKALLDRPLGAELNERIDRLTETRHDAVDTSAAELRRIERDLHDGAQARLVAMGMNLGTIEALVEKDPARAKELIAMARRNSAEALAELRDLVRGIHPPVLAERGLGDAVRALALRLPIPAEVDVELPGRADAPVESAVYFAVSETLTNAVKHGGAERIWVDVGHRDGMLRVSVTDDGCGGARIGGGSGLSGIERRLGTFDGVLAVNSPAGGPTMVTMEIPCELS